MDAAKAWWTAALGVVPYFDEPYYVGYSVAGYELGLLPDADPADGALVYWGVDNVGAAMSDAVAGGADLQSAFSATATTRSSPGQLAELVVELVGGLDATSDGSPSAHQARS